MSEIAKTKPSKKEIWLKVLEYFLVVAIPMVIFLFGMIVRGVSPFGSGSLAIIDYNDGLIPSYTGLWDVFHGKESFLIDWIQGAGGSNFASYITNSFLSPLSWLVALFKREEIIYAIAMLFIIRLMLMNFTAYYYFRKLFPNVNKWVVLLLSLSWTFSGWTLVHYTNIGWLDIMILFPILIYEAKRLVFEHKTFWFVIVLSYMLMLSYYITYMILVAAVIVGLLYVVLLAKEKKKVSSLMFYSIIISILISMVVFIPSCITSLGAHRFSSTTVSAPQADLFSSFFTKLTTIIMFALPFVFFFRLMLCYKKDKKAVLFFMLSFIICSIGILIEPINKMWHTGSYYCFPIRYAFVLVMILITGSLYYLNNFYGKTAQPAAENEQTTAEDAPKKKYKVNWVAIFAPALTLAALLLTLWLGLMGNQLLPYRQTPFKFFFLYFLMFATTWGAIELCLHIKSAKFKLFSLNGGVLVFIICLLQIVSLTVGYIGQPLFDTTSRVENVYKIDTSLMEQGFKIKDREYSLNDNFAKLMDYPTLSSWIHISPEEQWKAMDTLGYNTHSTVLCSSGSTPLVDVLMGNRYVLSRDVLDSHLYKKLGEFDYTITDLDFDDPTRDSKIYLYEYDLKFSQVFLTDIDFSTLNVEGDYVDFQNKLFKSIYNKSYNIMEKAELSIEETDEKFIIKVENSQNKIAYLYGMDLVRAKVNGIDRLLQTGLNEVGFAEDVISVEISKEDYPKLTKETIEETYKGATFDALLFQTINAQYEQNDGVVAFKSEKLYAKVTNSSNKKYALIPFTYLKNMDAKINDEKSQIITAFGSFIEVELEEGENDIVVTYTPQLFMPCLIITLVSALIFAIFTILNKKFNLASNKFVIWFGFIGACLILAVVGVLVYLKPLFDFFVLCFKALK